MDSFHSSWNASNTSYPQKYEDVEELHSVVEVFPVITDSPDDGWVGKIGLSVILMFGTFGNVMTIIVLRKLRSGWSAMNVYLTALAISDTAMLYSAALAMWARKVMNIDLFAVHVVSCKMMIWVLNTSASLSSWLLVALTAQRAASVVWPHRINILCTRQRSMIIILVTTITCSLLYSHTLYGYELVSFENSTSVRCTFGFPDYQHFWISTWVQVDMFVYCLLPCTFLLMCNTVLGWKLKTSVKEMNENLSSMKGDQRDSRKKRASSATLTIITVSTAFVLMSVPLMIYNVLYNQYASQDEQSRQFYYMLYDFFVVCSLSNFAWNFYLYCLSGTKFRREFLKILFGCCGYSSLTTRSNRSAHFNEGIQRSGVETVQKKKGTEMESNEDF